MNVCQSNLLLVGIHLHLYTIDGLHNSTATAPAKTADETPVALLAPGKGKTHRAYMWVYRSTDYVAQRAVWFDFCSGRGGEHPRRVLKDYVGTLVTDDYAAYKSIYAGGAIIEAGCMAHYLERCFIQ